MVEVLSVAVVVGSGVVAGVLFAVALSVFPALQAMPADRYVYTHKLVGRHWDPTMPVLVLSSTAADVVLAAVSAAGRPWFGAAAVLLAAVSVVSHFCNVPINRRVKSLPDWTIPAGWRDPRPLWRRWHLLRTALAALAALANAVGAITG
ncbi:anthrone oxygenase family protein [Nonomuraea wenchangensis]|uniref:anthrone oxygenase family protein n=1 Tax=Nonomuraea wenchangensis TaxID=568860 RepID=UPI003323B9C6